MFMSMFLVDMSILLGVDVHMAEIHVHVRNIALLVVDLINA